MKISDKKLTTGYARAKSQAFFLPFETDGQTVKLWTRFDSGGVDLTDYSHFKNKIEIRYGEDAPQPELIMAAEDDGVAGNKISSHCEQSKKHYFRVTDRKFNLSEKKHFCFFFKISPTIIDNEAQTEGQKRATLLNYIEDDQVKYAVKVQVDDTGHLYFFVRYEFVDYFVKTTDPVFVFPDVPDYYSQDYAEEDYYASPGDETYSIPVPFQYIFCIFDKDTRQVKVIRPIDATNYFSWESTALEIPQWDNLSLWLPLTEGGNTETVTDLSGLDNHGSFADSTSKPEWIIQDGKRVLEFGESDHVLVEKTTSLNTLTSWTVSYIIYLHSDFYSINHSKVMFRFAATGNGRFLIYHPSGTSRNVRVDVVNNEGTTRFLDLGSNQLPASAGTYAHVVVTYDGSEYKSYVNGNIGSVTPDHSGDEFTNSDDMIIGTTSTNGGGHTNMSHVMFWKNKALTLEEVQSLYNSFLPLVTAYQEEGDLVPPDTPPFPDYKQDPEEPPEPGTPTTLPFEKTGYDQQTGANYQRCGAVTVSGLTEVYNVEGGEPEEDPQTSVYTVIPGTGSETSTDPQTIYNLNMSNPSDNSHGTLTSSEKAYAQRISSTSSVLYGQKITEISVRLKDGTSNPSGGTLNIGVIKNDGSFIAFGSAINLGDLTSSYQTFTRTNTSNDYVMQNGDGVGIIWTGGGRSGNIHILRGGSGNHFENSNYSSQCIHNGSSWGNHNTNFSMAAVIKKGGGTIITDPYLRISGGASGEDFDRHYAVGELFGTSSSMIGEVPTKIQLRVYRHASANSGNLHLRHVDSSNNVKATLKTVAISSLPTTAPTTFNFEWEDLEYETPIANNDRIMVWITDTTNTNPVYVLGNDGATGSNSSYDSPNTRSHVVYRRTAYPGIVIPGFGTFGARPEAWVSNTSLDISGNIYKGGNNFTGYISLNATRKRTGIKVDTATSSLKGKKITKVTATIKKVGTLTAGAIYCRIRDSSGNIKVTLNQVDITEIEATDTSVDFLNTTHNVTLAVDDTISIEYDLGDASNYLDVRVNKNQFESTNTILFESLAASPNTTTPVNDRDLAAIVYEGGEVDANARPRVGLSVNNALSSLIDRAITKIELWLKREGSEFEEGDKFTVKVIRGSDKATVSILGEMDILDVHPTVGTKYTFENVGNSYSMKAGDMIVVENLHGNSTNYLWVKVSNTPAIDDTATCLVDWNGNSYNLDTSRDLNAVCYVGGFTIYPDPAIPTPPTPYHYSHDIFIGSSTTEDGGAIADPASLEPDQETMFNWIAGEFIVYQGRLIEEEEACNKFVNKHTITALPFGTPHVVAHAVLASESE